MNPSSTISVCFVCLGNICRSPLAEGLFQNLVDREGLTETILIESAGTGGWHVGSPPDERMQATAKKQGIFMTSRAQQFQAGDFNRFDLILAMDQSNYESLEYMCSPEVAKEKLRMFRSFDPDSNGNMDVPDPYYGGDSGFDLVFQIVKRTCPAILDHLKSKHLS